MKKPDTEKLSGFFLYKKKMKIFIASKLYKICEIIGKIKKSFFFRGDLPLHILVVALPRGGAGWGYMPYRIPYGEPANGDYGYED